MEQQRRASAEGRLQRALENNGALARNNLRLQEQLARLRGEADVRQHEQGCQRAAAAARQSEAAAKLAALQERLQQAAADKAALLSQLAGKQQVIVDLQRKLAALSSSSAGQVAAGGSGSAGGSSSSLTTAAPNQDDSFEASAGSLATLSIADAAAAPGQPLGDLSEGEEAPEDGTEASSASPAATASPAAAQQPAGCADQVTPMAPAQQTPPSEQDRWSSLQCTCKRPAGVLLPWPCFLLLSLCPHPLQPQRRAAAHRPALLPAGPQRRRLHPAQPAQQAAAGGPLHLWRGRSGSSRRRWREARAGAHQAAPAVCRKRQQQRRRRPRAATGGRLSSGGMPHAGL